MTTTVRAERISTADGEFDAHVALPEAGSGPGIVVLQEIFGVGDYIKESAGQLCDFANSRPNMECHIQADAGHAFDNHDAPMFHQPEPAARAWEITREFLARTLPA